MDKGDLFVNDGSFFEKFKRLEKEKAAAPAGQSKPTDGSSAASKPFSILANKRALDLKVSDTKKTNASASGGKLAFSLKQKSKIAVAPVKFTADDEEDGEAASRDEPGKRQKLVQANATDAFSHQEDVAPSPPSDPAVRKVADRLAIFVAKNGRQLEHITRQRNPGDTPFKFLFDSSCPDYKYYEYRLFEEERALAQSKDNQGSSTDNSTIPSSRALTGSQRSVSNYQTPASALYGTYEDNSGSTSNSGEAGGSAADSVAMMEFYMKKAAQEERKRPPKHSKDEMPPPSSLQGPPKKGHHMGDYIPQEELERFLSQCNDAAAQKAAKEAAEKAKIQADNIGHKLLSKMGWREGEGLGSDKSGRAEPVMAGNVKLNNLGVGAQQPGEVTPEDDIYEQYKKRMMLGYRHRPNPLGNPRKAYY